MKSIPMLLNVRLGRSRFLVEAHGKACLCLTLLALVLLMASAQSAVLIYEGFDGYDTANNAFRDQSPNANTVGLRTDASNTYASSPTASIGNITVQPTGMTFGDLDVSGGRLSFDAAGVVVSARLASTTTGLSAGSTLYTSFLVNFSTINPTGNNGFVVRLGETDTGSVAMFNSMPVSRTNDGTEGLATAYNSIAYQASSTGNALSTNTDYIILSRFTNVGSTLSAGTPGVAEIWALTESQFEGFIDNDRDYNWLGVSGNVSAYSTQSVTSETYNLSDSYHLHIVNLNQVGTVDEIRFGTSFLDVTPVVPEPSRAFLLSLALSGFLLRRRR